VVAVNYLIAPGHVQCVCFIAGLRSESVTGWPGGCRLSVRQNWHACKGDKGEVFVVV